jgi:transposase
MGMIMGLCLLVYTLAQRQIRNALKESKSTIKNRQFKNETHQPQELTKKGSSVCGSLKRLYCKVL